MASCIFSSRRARSAGLSTCVSDPSRPDSLSCQPKFGIPSPSSAMQTQLMCPAMTLTVRGRVRAEVMSQKSAVSSSDSNGLQW